MTNSTTKYSELELIDKLVFKPCMLEIVNVQTEKESEEYFAQNFQIGTLKVKFRVAKITPKKIGQFVSICKRNNNGITEPFNIVDDIDFYIIATRQNENFGLFIFSKMVLYENKILADNIRDGKRGIRVYPAWDIAINKQAQKTQDWQLKYFLEIKHKTPIDLKKVKRLLDLKE